MDIADPDGTRPDLTRRHVARTAGHRGPGPESRRLGGFARQVADDLGGSDDRRELVDRRLGEIRPYVKLVARPAVFSHEAGAKELNEDRKDLTSIAIA